MFPGRVILMEKSDLEAERVALFESVMQNQRSMKELESNLLCRLTSTQVCKKHFSDEVIKVLYHIMKYFTHTHTHTHVIK
jgi:dynein heavy chain